ncbi:MAG: PQQ-binding-like beta-propeller repeat protein [Phycisphaerae bacterium]|nr:PQQ-binding-like beta-propeller repeat protein [Phycisphaerae bacterium]
MTYRRRFGIGLVLVAAAATPGLAQPLPPDAEADKSNDDAPSVFVADSFEAGAALRRADRLADDKRWRDAAQAYQQAVERFPGKLIRTSPRAYVGPSEYANRRIAAWPPEGLDAYRLLFAPEAEKRLAEARASRDLDALLSLTDDLYCTRQAATAADLAARLAMESGEFALARRLYERCLADHPDRKDFAGEYLTKLCLAFVWDGRSEKAQELLERIRTEHPDGVMTWAGQSRKFTDVIQEAIAGRAPPLATRQAFSWPVVGGSVAGDRVAADGVEPGAPFWEFAEKQGFHPSTAVRDDDQRNRRGLRGNWPERGGYDLSLVPVSDGENVYLADEDHVWAIRAADGSPAWEPFGIKRGEVRGRATMSRQHAATVNACTLSNGRLYAILGQPVNVTGRVPSSGGAGALVCLDTSSGKPLWGGRLTDLAAELAETVLDGAPLFYQGKLFAVARRRKRFGFEECHLIRLDARTGRLEWMRHLASASSVSYGLGPRTLAIPAISEGIVYVCTNLGAVAAVSAHDGGIRWLQIYHKDETAEQAGARFARSLLPWRFGPPICWRDKLICGPLDSDSLMILDRADGNIVHRIEAGDLDRFEQILGVVDDVLYTAGRELTAWDLNAGQPRWSRSLSLGENLLGRGQLTRTHVYLPLKQGLYRFAIAGGQPTWSPWPEDAVGGNVLVRPEVVVVAGSDRVTGYVPKDEAFARLQNRIDADPKDPSRWLDLAEVAFRVGERKQAVTAMKQAVEVSGGFAQLSDPKLKARIFQDLIGFGDRAMASEPPDESLALELYSQAAECPPDPDAHVIYRLRLAEVLLALSRPEQAIEQYQQIIGDRGLRVRTTKPRDVDDTWPAGQWAEKQIASILSRYGRGVYASFEKRAQSMLEMGVEQKDIEMIRRVVEGFPNSEAARQGLLAKAELQQQRGQYAEAVRAYLQLLQRGGKKEDEPAIIRRIAEAYLQANRSAAAGRWLARGARMFPKYRFDRDGQPIGFEAYRRLTAEVKDDGPPLPKSSLPLSARWSREFPGRVTILPPIYPELRTTRWDLCAVYFGSQVQLFEMPGFRAKWTTPLACEGHPSLLGMTERMLILISNRQILGVSIDSGKVAWSIEARPADADRPELDPEVLARFETWTMTEDRVFAVLQDGQTICVDADRGQVLWRVRLPVKPERRPMADEEFFVYEANIPHESKSFVHVLDAETGRQIRQIDTSTHGRSVWTSMSPEGLLVAATGRSLYAVDPYTGEFAWKISETAHNLRAVTATGPEGVYLTHNGQSLVRRSLATGEILAESPVLSRAAVMTDIPMATRDHVFVLSLDEVVALDARTLDVLWRGATDRSPNLSRCCIGRPFVVAVSELLGERPDMPGRRFMAYFYDRRNDSGLIPADGGWVDLGHYTSARRAYFGDHTLLIADEDRVYGWTGPGN